MQHMARWWGLISTQRQARQLISVTVLYRIKSRDFSGFLTGHNTLRRHRYIMGLIDIPLFRKCGEEEETSSHILCLSKALDPTRYTYLGFFFLDANCVGCLTLRAAWNF